MPQNFTNVNLGLWINKGVEAWFLKNSKYYGRREKRKNKNGP